MKIQSKDKEPEEIFAVPEAGRLFGPSFQGAPLWLVVLLIVSPSSTNRLYRICTSGMGVYAGIGTFPAYLLAWCEVFSIIGCSQLALPPKR